jgi:probable F420-dependent oxidoreductase
LVKFCASLAFSNPRHFREVAVAAESAGWDALVVSDHVVHPETIESPYPYTADNTPRWEAPAPWPDPWVAIGAMAAVTERVRFMTSIFVLPMRNPIAVAKTVGTAAVMSDYRVDLGIGIGWMKEEFDLLGQNFRNRGKRTDEMVEVMRKLWAGGMVEHHGKYYDFDRLQMSPAVEGEIPIIVGGLSEPALRRAARIGDGWTSDIHTTDELREIVATLAGYRAEYGRAEEPFSIFAAASDAIDADGYKRLEEAGVTHLLTMPWLLYGSTGDSLEEKTGSLERFGNEIIAKMR